MGQRRIIVGPVGPGSTFGVLAAAEEAMASGRRFALVLPGRAARDHARNELCRRAGRCDPAAVETFSGLARRLLGARAPRLASPRERDALLSRALLETGGAEELLALRYRGFRHALLTAFGECEQSGVVDASSLARALRAARLDPPRLDRLVRAYQGYRQGLQRERLSTDPDLLALAADALARGREAAPVPSLVLLDGFVDLSPRQLQLLGAVALKAEETVLTWPVAPGPCQAFASPDRVRRRLVEELAFIEEARPAPPSDPRPPVLRRLAARLFAPEADPPDEEDPAPADGTGLRVLRAASRRDEVEQALLRAREWVLGRDAPGPPTGAAGGEPPARRWTDVLLVLPSIRLYRPVVEEVARELGVPVRVRGPLSLATHPLVQGALAFLRAAAGFELAPLLAAAACPSLGLEPESAERLADAAGQRGLPSGASEDLWEELAEELSGECGRFVRRGLELGRALREALERDPSARSGAHLARRALERQLRPALLADLGDRPGHTAVQEAAAEVAAQRELLALLADLERLGVPLVARAGAPGPQELVARIEEEVRAADLRPLDPRRQVLHAVDAREARAWEADLVLVLGLSERDLPRGLHDDLYIPEGARRALGPARRAGSRLRLELKSAQDRANEDLFLFYSAATRARRELWLCQPGFGPGGAPLAPSRHLEAVKAAVGEAAWEAAWVARGPSQLVPDEPAEVLTLAAARRFAWRRVSSVSRPDGPAAEKARLALALFASLLGREDERGRAARALRGSEPSLTGPLGARRALQRVYSATELEAYAACPFRHFVQFVLGVRPRDDLGSSGLDARRQGMLVHEALERIYARGEAPEAALEASFTRAARELDIGLAEDALRRQASATVRAFVGEDDPAFRAVTGLVPHAFEQQFGPRVAAREGPRADVLRIPAPELGGEIQVRGAIDRIDLLPPPAPAPTTAPAAAPAPAPALGPPRGGASEDPRPAGFVTDYKLGGREVDAEYLDGMHKGENLQIPLYLLALERVFGIRALGASFAALGTRRRTGILDVSAPPWERTLGQDPRFRLHRLPLAPLLWRTEEQVRRIVAGIAAGVIDPLPRDAAECERCDVRDVCRLDPFEARRRARNGRALPLERIPRGLPAAAAAQ